MKLLFAAALALALGAPASAAVLCTHPKKDGTFNGPVKIEDYKIAPPPRAAMKENMEALIHHFLLFSKGYTVPPGEGARSLAVVNRSGG